MVDPFCGTGTTLLAAKNLGRPAVGIEIEESFCEIAVRRLAQETLELSEVDPLFTPQGTRTDAWMKMRGDEDLIIESAIETVEGCK